VNRVVFAESATPPIAVLLTPVVLPIERLITIGRVSVDGIVKERLYASGRVEVAIRVMKQCARTSGRVGAAVEVVKGVRPNRWLY
jgi:hypothetical protein